MLSLYFKKNIIDLFFIPIWRYNPSYFGHTDDVFDSHAIIRMYPTKTYSDRTEFSAESTEGAGFWHRDGI